MQQVIDKIQTTDWDQVASKMHAKGYACVKKFLSPDQCRELIGLYDAPEKYRKTVIMERHRFGLGEYKYFSYPLPEIVQTLREHIYPLLVPIANTWMKALKIDRQFCATWGELQQICAANDQLKPTPLLLKYGKGGFNALHQDLYGEIYFPLQLVFCLNEPEVDFTGGELVLTQQTPRAQSKAIVLKPLLGDMIIFTTNFRPIKGTKGYYRVNMKHGVSEIHSGQRHTLGIIFHDAKS